MTTQSMALTGFTGWIAGGVFGFCLNQAKTNVPGVISAFFQLKNFTMLRMFLGASIGSTVSAMIAGYINSEKIQPSCGRSFKSFKFGANFLGGILLGTGMYLSGSCPGTVWAGIGAGVPLTQYVVAGGLIGTILYGYFEPKMKFTTECTRYGPQSHILQLLMMIGGLAGFSSLVSWKMDSLDIAPQSTPAFSVTADVWDPLLSGLILGMIQLPLFFTPAQGLGASSGWACVAGNIVAVVDEKHETKTGYFAEALKNQKAIFQTFSAVGIVCGAALAQYLSGYPPINPAYLTFATPLRSFIGGVTMLFGARLAQGCTSGAGLTGMAKRSLASIATLAGLFAGGFAMALVV